jgi:hypothetical protein
VTAPVSPIANAPGPPAPDTIFGLSATDVTALATIVLAVVATFALIANWRLARSTRTMAKATETAAQASKEAAQATGNAAQASKEAAQATEAEAQASRETVSEMRQDREMAYRPLISWSLSEVTTNGQGGPVLDKPNSPRVVGANFGRGPAIYCLCVAFWPNQMVKVRSSLLFDLSPNESMSQDGAVIRAEPRAWTVPGPDVTGPVAAGTDYFRVAFCQDQLGNAYWFVPFRDIEVWRPSAQRPGWLEWYEARRQDLERL